MSVNSSQCTGTSELHLRPHHLLCLQTFVGRGYSEEFVEHMTLVKKQLTTNPRTPITLVCGADDLCAHCPNCVEGQCTSEKPRTFDRLVNEKLNSVYDTKRQVKFESFGNYSSQQCFPINEKTLIECCPECEWLELCLKVCKTHL